MPEAFPTLPPVLDYAGVAVFALTGALAAARAKHDLVTFLFFAVVTGVGGGTLRDLLIGARVFWIGDAAYLIIGAVAALAVWLFADRLERTAALIWIDAVGLAAYAVIGAGKALSLGVEPAVAAAMGVLTACFGGVLRDVLANQPSILLKREIYVSAALIASGLFVALAALTISLPWAGAIGALAGFVLRAGAIHYGWALPAFRERRS
jgi:uncharacterized membrane protein YeiH